MAAKIDIVNIDGDRITLQVQYGRDKTARLEIRVPDPQYDQVTPADTSRFEVHELTAALNEWSADVSATIGDLRRR